MRTFFQPLVNKIGRERGKEETDTDWKKKGRKEGRYVERMRGKKEGKMGRRERERSRRSRKDVDRRKNHLS